jgi:outer membrane receptor for ferric coprogen and ferric-rhodotorulic acid
VVDDGRAYRISPTAFINGGKVENQGVDFEVNAIPLKCVELTAGYTYLKTKVIKSASDEKNEGLAFSPVEPEHSFKFWGVYRFETGVLQNLSAGVCVMAYSPKWASVLTPERRQGSYAVANAFVSYAVKPHLSFNLNLNNIFDKTYYARVGGNGDYFGEPRNFSVSMRCSF